MNEINFEITKIHQNKLSAEVMYKTFISFRGIIEKAQPHKLKELLFRIIEVVEWYENDNGRVAGHCKISYFEQPNFKFPINRKANRVVNTSSLSVITGSPVWT